MCERASSIGRMDGIRPPTRTSRGLHFWHKFDYQTNWYELHSSETFNNNKKKAAYLLRISQPSLKNRIWNKIYPGLKRKCSSLRWSDYYRFLSSDRVTSNLTQTLIYRKVYSRSLLHKNYLTPLRPSVKVTVLQWVAWSGNLGDKVSRHVPTWAAWSFENGRPVTCIWYGTESCNLRFRMYPPRLLNSLLPLPMYSCVPCCFSYKSYLAAAVASNRSKAWNTRI